MIYDPDNSFGTATLTMPNATEQGAAEEQFGEG
jgi:hypothetical protein